jgi:uncharacterized lipoprotein YddW (UPF0748 family)
VKNLLINAVMRIIFILLLLASSMRAAQTNLIFPPPPAREFRAAWIATVANIDWPSKPGLPVAQQKAELISLLDRAAQLHFNAVFFQVRSVADAFYPSSLEPWSEYLTGTQGRAPEPFYDPLAFALNEAHQRGLQLFAWFNPFRAGHPQSKSPPAFNHVTRTHPEIIQHYAEQIWLDPGEPESQTRALNAVLDVVKRYDVDGIVFDDYFYPYPEKSWNGHELDFPDDASWKKYGAKSGLTRDDWRRENVNQFVQKISRAIKAAKPQMQFGISPFGIWRPQNPPQIRGLDAYAKLYADARRWLASGWVDFLAPQLYWATAAREQSFPVLFNWWRAQNIKGRHLFAALNDAGVGGKFSADEIGRQIQIVRAQSTDAGEVHYHLRSVLENSALAAIVRFQYALPALVPTSPWIVSAAMMKPKLSVDAEKKSSRIRWESSGGEPSRQWLLQWHIHGIWITEILAMDRTDFYLESAPDAVCLRAVDHLGNLSEPAIWTPKKYAPVSNDKGATHLKK